MNSDDLNTKNAVRYVEEHASHYLSDIRKEGYDAGYAAGLERGKQIGLAKGVEEGLFKGRAESYDSGQHKGEIK